MRLDGRLGHSLGHSFFDAVELHNALHREVVGQPEPVGKLQWIFGPAGVIPSSFVSSRLVETEEQPPAGCPSVFRVGQSLLELDDHQLINIFPLC